MMLKPQALALTSPGLEIVFTQGALSKWQQREKK